LEAVDISDLFRDLHLWIAERAQQGLEALPAGERAEFIKKKSHVWRAFARYLSKMSYGKCWYSESGDPQSFFDVDHFRPKLEACRGEKVVDRPGYEWLAFSWENFRLSSQRSNRQSRDEDTEELSGKGNWFPLLENSPKACWDDRCEANEQPVLLDPTNRPDVDLIEAGADGLMVPSRLSVGVATARVERSIEIYGLNLPRLVEARKRVMRDIIDTHTNLIDTLVAHADHPRPNDLPVVQRAVGQLRRSTLPNSPFSKAARNQLMALDGGAQICGQPEDLPVPA
jgi:hypothetical protein